MEVHPMLIEKLAELLPVVVGALLASAGALIKHFTDRSSDRRRIKREKLETLANRIYAIFPWTNQLDSYAAGLADLPMDSPLEDIEVLQALYFPELSTHISTILNEARKYRTAAIHLATERLETGKHSENYVDIIHRSFRPLRQAIDEFGVAASRIGLKQL